MSEGGKDCVVIICVVAMVVFTLICLAHVTNMNCDVKEYILNQTEYREFVAQKKKDKRHEDVEGIR